MIAIMRREFTAYFHSPIGYIFLAVFYLFAGFFFFSGSLFGRNADLGGVFEGLFIIMLFLIPILTMRLMSEERKNKTDQALLTAPVSITGMVIGKFLSAALVFLMGLCVTLLYAVVVGFFAPAGWPAVLGGFFASLLLGMAMISIGMFISSLTENQVIAAVGGFAAALGLLLVGVLQTVFQNPLAVKIIQGISFYDRYFSFSLGIFNYSSVLFFLSVCAMFIFLTIRVFEKRRWD